MEQNIKLYVFNIEESKFLTSRLHDEVEEKIAKRQPFQRDRDRIIHSRAFRRMMHKTQIFNANKGDHYRNRLTHTLEVMQIARSIGRHLGLNEDLIEAIALGHDLGHTPFGHIGERTLCEIMYDGLGEMNGIQEDFKHNFQTLRVVDSIERRCDEYLGMNLTMAVREGMIKHTKLVVKNDQGEHKVYYHPDELNVSGLRLDLPFSYTLEGQVVAIADEVAQITHDIEDGIRGGIINQDKFEACKLVKKYETDQLIEKPSTNIQKQLLIKGLIGYLISDICVASKKRIRNYLSKNEEPCFVDENDVFVELCIGFSDEIKPLAKELADNRDKWILCSKEISQADHKAEYMIKQMYKAYYKHPLELPDYILARYYNLRLEELDRSMIDEEKLKLDRKFKRFVCDHIAGMTDQFAAREYKELYQPDYV